MHIHLDVRTCMYMHSPPAAGAKLVAIITGARPDVDALDDEVDAVTVTRHVAVEI